MNNVTNEIELLEARLRILRAEAAANAKATVVDAGPYREPSGDNAGGVMENISGIAAEAGKQFSAGFNTAYSTAKSWWTGAAPQATGIVETVRSTAAAAYSYCYRGVETIVAAATAAAERVGHNMKIAYLRGYKAFRGFISDATAVWLEKDLEWAKNSAYASVMTITGGVIASMAGFATAAQVLLAVGSLLFGFALGISLALPLVYLLTVAFFAAAAVVGAIYFAYDYVISVAEELLAPQATAIA